MSPQAERIKAPNTGPSVHDYLMEFSPAELLAFRAAVAAEDVVLRVAEDLLPRANDELTGALYEAERRLSDFYEARLCRLLPGQADLIAWVFNHTTRGQAAELVMSERSAPEMGSSPGD